MGDTPPIFPSRTTRDCHVVTTSSQVLFVGQPPCDHCSEGVVQGTIVDDGNLVVTPHARAGGNWSKDPFGPHPIDMEGAHPRHIQF